MAKVLFVFHSPKKHPFDGSDIVGVYGEKANKDNGKVRVGGPIGFTFYEHEAAYEVDGLEGTWLEPQAGVTPGILVG